VTDGVRVLFVTGFPRSGSTVLGCLLNELPDAFFAGELDRLWTMLQSHRVSKCGCGERAGRCELWRSIVEAAVPELRTLAPPERDRRLAELSEEYDGLAAGSSRGTATTPPPSGPSALMAALYREIARETGARVVVDSSKRPRHARSLARIPGIDPWLLHLVRDVRGAVFSRQRNRDLRLAEDRHPRPALARLRLALLVADALRWMRDNLEARRARRWLPQGRYRRLRYEDFAAAPEEALASLASWLGLAGPLPARSPAGTMRLSGNHSISGNRNRHERGEVAIREDRAWTAGLTRLERATLTLLTWPVGRALGYPRAAARS